MIKKLDDGLFNSTLRTDDNRTRKPCRLPYKGPRGEKLLRTLAKTISEASKDTISVRTTFSGTKLTSRFNLKDRVKKIHQHDIIYQATCPATGCHATYFGETSRRLSTRAEEHAGKDKNSHIWQHSNTHHHPPVTIDDFTIIDSNNSNSYFGRKIRESLLIKSRKPSLNVQGQSFPLKLFE